MSFSRKLILKGSRLVFVDDKTFFVILKEGAVYPVEIVVVPQGLRFVRICMLDFF